MTYSKHDKAALLMTSRSKKLNRRRAIRSTLRWAQRIKGERPIMATRTAHLGNNKTTQNHRALSCYRYVMMVIGQCSTCMWSLTVTPQSPHYTDYSRVGLVHTVSNLLIHRALIRSVHCTVLYLNSSILYYCSHRAYWHGMQHPIRYHITRATLTRQK